MKQKGSSDVKGSLWNHLDKKVLLWHCEAPLFFKSVCGVNKILTVKLVLANKRTCEKCLSHHRTLSNQIKSLLLSHHHSTSALVSEILMSVLQTVQKTKQNKKKQFTYGQYYQTQYMLFDTMGENDKFVF